MEQQLSTFSEVSASRTVRKQTKVTGILKIKIIPPFKREHFEYAETFQKASNEALSSILLAFDPVNHQQITLSKRFTTINEKRLHTVLVIAPIEAAKNMDRLKKRTKNNEPYYDFDGRRILAHGI